MRSIKKEEVTFKINVEAEDFVLVSEDPEQDRETKEWVISQLKRGNMYAWCFLKVEAHWENFVGVANLGACSFVNEWEVFDYIEEVGMKEEALGDLNSKVREFVKAGKRIEALLNKD